jgi:hypothetical protein
MADRDKASCGVITSSGGMVRTARRLRFAEGRRSTPWPVLLKTSNLLASFRNLGVLISRKLIRSHMMKTAI